MKSVRELGYMRCNVAVSMITGRTNVILFLVPEFVNSAFSYIAQGVENYIRRFGYAIMIHSISNDPNVDLESMLAQFSGMFDGLIIIPTENLIPSLYKLKTPFVVIDRCIHNLNFPTVSADNEGGIYELTRLLLQANHRKIAIICADTPLNIGEGRLNGYLKALNEYGVNPSEEFIYRGSLFQEFGYKSVVRMMHGNNKPTAIVACGRLLCMGAIIALNDIGLAVGKDISIVGFDDNVLASSLNPGVTVVSGNQTELGKRAAKMLLDRINNPNSPVEELIIDVTLIERNSIVKLAKESD